jgi:PTS system fructose-specific IIA component
MEINSILDPQNIIFEPSINSKQQLFRKIAELLKMNGFVKNSKKFIKDLEKRENEAPTGIEDGFGIPHAKSKYVVKPTIVFAHTGIISDYIALDNTKVQYTFTLAVPKGSADIHLDLLSALSRKLMDDGFRDRLKKAQTKNQVLDVLASDSAEVS